MLKLEVVTPEKRVVDADVDSVTVPTVSGEVGIMPNHAPLISAMKPGVLSYAVKGTSEKLVVSGGFVEVNSNKVSILVDSAETADEIDVETARLDRESAERAISEAAQAPIEQTESSREILDHANARIQAAGSR